MILDGQTSREVAGYREDGDSYVVTTLSGGTSRYPKNKVQGFEALTPAQQPAAAPLEGGSKPLASDIAIASLPTSGTVSLVVDGDTIALENGERVRLIGVDTPETVHPSKPVEQFGKEASAFTSGRLDGEKVRLEYDEANATIGHRDRYGRLLAYVRRDRDNLDFNAELIRKGFAHAYVNYPFSRMEEFRALERQARSDGVGLWESSPTTDTINSLSGPSGGTPAAATRPLSEPNRPAEPSARQKDKSEQTVYVTKTGAKYHLSGCRHLSKSKIAMTLSEAQSRYGPCSVCGPPR